MSIREDDAGFIVEDLSGAVYGVGGSIREALDDFYRGLDLHLAELRRHREQLHERLSRQLEQLERWFPGR